MNAFQWAAATLRVPEPAKESDEWWMFALKGLWGRGYTVRLDCNQSFVSGSGKDEFYVVLSTPHCAGHGEGGTPNEALCRAIESIAACRCACDHPYVEPDDQALSAPILTQPLYGAGEIINTGHSLGCFYTWVSGGPEVEVGAWESSGAMA